MIQATICCRSRSGHSDQPELASELFKGASQVQFPVPLYFSIQSNPFLRSEKQQNDHQKMQHLTFKSNPRVYKQRLMRNPFWKTLDLLKGHVIIPGISRGSLLLPGTSCVGPDQGACSTLLGSWSMSCSDITRQTSVRLKQLANLGLAVYRVLEGIFLYCNPYALQVS